MAGLLSSDLPIKKRFKLPPVFRAESGIISGVESLQTFLLDSAHERWPRFRCFLILFHVWLRRNRQVVKRGRGGSTGCFNPKTLRRAARPHEMRLSGRLRPGVMADPAVTCHRVALGYNWTSAIASTSIYSTSYQYQSSPLHPTTSVRSH